MAYTTIDDPSAHFQVDLYTGNGSSQSLTFDGNSDMQPDWLWTKCRSDNFDPIMRDTSRGIANRLLVHATDAEGGATGTTSFDSDGFSVDSTVTVNSNSETFVAWGWKANGGSRTTFTESGANPGGGHQANTTAGFSIVDYTGTGSAGTVSHGLGATPHWIIVKRRDATSSWIVYHHKNTSAPETDILELQATNATYDNSTYWNDTAPTSSVFTVNTSSDGNADSGTYIAYVFTEIQGYSKFGKYVGNGSESGPFVYTGFKPRWILFKNTGAAEEWVLQDTVRNPHNPVTKNIRADSNNAEADASALDIDFLGNGFKNRSDNAQLNTNGVTYVYMAFAQHPFVSSEGVPTTAGGPG